jgi:hypothetical protein
MHNQQLDNDHTICYHSKLIQSKEFAHRGSLEYSPFNVHLQALSILKAWGLVALWHFKHSKGMRPSCSLTLN